MSGQSHYPNSDGKPMIPTNGYHWQGNVYDEADSAYYNDSIVYPPHTSYTGWNNSMETNRLQQPFHRDGTLSHPLPSSPAISRSSNSYVDAQPWTWGTSPSQSTTFYGSEIPFYPSSSTAGSSRYSYADATSSLSSNDVSHDYTSSMPMQPQGMDLQPSSLLPAQRQHSPHSVRNVYSSDFQKSREPSPAHSDSDPKRRFPCMVTGCGRRFTSQYTLKVHMEAHKPKPRVSYECTFGCSEKFSRQHDRLRHEVAKHGKVCEFVCDDCGRFFSTSKTLGNHKCPVAQGSTRWVNNTG